MTARFVCIEPSQPPLREVQGLRLTKYFHWAMSSGMVAVWRESPWPVLSFYIDGQRESTGSLVGTKIDASLVDCSPIPGANDNEAWNLLITQFSSA